MITFIIIIVGFIITSFILMILVGYFILPRPSNDLEEETSSFDDEEIFFTPLPEKPGKVFYEVTFNKD